MMRMLISFLLSAPLTFLLMVFMSQMVPVKAEPPVIIDFVEPDFNNPEFDKDIEPKKPKVIPPKEVIEKPPETPDSALLPRDDVPEIDTPPIIESVEFTDTGIPVTIDGPDSVVPKGSQEATPTFIKAPVWPVEAEQSGYTKFCFTINADGTVSNIRLKEAAPGKLFVRNAKRALRSWKFRPAYEAGQAVPQHNMCYTLDFEFEG